MRPAGHPYELVSSAEVELIHQSPLHPLADGAAANPQVARRPG